MVRGARDTVSFTFRAGALRLVREGCWLGVTVRRHTWPNANWRRSLHALVPVGGAQSQQPRHGKGDGASSKPRAFFSASYARGWWLELSLMMAARQSLELTNHAPDLDSGKEPGGEKKLSCAHDGMEKSWKIGLGWAEKCFGSACLLVLTYKSHPFFSGKSYTCTRVDATCRRPLFRKRETWATLLRLWRSVLF